MTVPPHTSIRSKLMVRMAQDVAVPFVATIRKKRNGETTILKEKGVWKGVLVSDSYIENSDASGWSRSTGIKSALPLSMSQIVLICVASVISL